MKVALARASSKLKSTALLLPGAISATNVVRAIKFACFLMISHKHTAILIKSVCWIDQFDGYWEIALSPLDRIDPFSPRAKKYRMLQWEANSALENKIICGSQRSVIVGLHGRS